MTIIGLLHPGEMGAAIGATLAETGHSVLWVSQRRSPETAARAAAAGLEDAGTLAALAGRAEVILSICPPHAAIALAESLRGFDGPYVDANAISPDSARRIAELQPRLIDGGIVGPPPTRPGSTRLYLSGPEATEIAALFTHTTVPASVVSGEVGGASALKMAYAAYTKGSQALLLGVRAVARAENVEAALLAEWETSQPTLEARSRSAAQSALAKGWRWSGEMEEIARTFGAAGLPDGFHRASAEIFARSPRADGAAESALDEVLSALLGAGADPP